MNIEIISFGKSKDSTLSESEKEYLKRLKNEQNIKLTQLPQGKGKDTTTTLAEEAKTLLNYLPLHSYLVILDEYAEQMTSKEFAFFLQKHKNQATQTLILAIGGPYGWDNTVRKRANFSLSLSKLTFPAHVAKFLIIEQLYRATAILNGHPYHK